MSAFDWLDHRTGFRKLVHSALFEHVPGGARWRYVWGSTLSFAIVTQFITGILLWTAYSPSAQSAWESVFYMQEHMPLGWLVRGLHHWTAQLMVPLLVLHLMQVVIDGAYKAPREVNYWFGLGLTGLTLALSLTGYLLPWDQKGMWATKVATNLMSSVPFVGPALQRMVVGGPDYGHHTLMRFFALHAGVLPAALVALIVGHIYLFRRHGITVKEPKKKPDAMFWPDQVLKDAIACLAVAAAVLGLTIWKHGAELTAPANPAENYSAARPDWYFMGLFQLLKFQDWFEQHLPGGGLLWCVVIIPSAMAAILFLLPLWSRWKAGHFFNLAFLWAGLGVFGAFTVMAYRHDFSDPHYLAAVKVGEHDAARVKVLASRKGIPTEGALALLREDALTQAPKLFAAKCSSCHSYDGHNGLGVPIPEKEMSAADLKGWGSRKWLTDFMDPTLIQTARWWGGTAFVHPAKGKDRSPMVDYILDDAPKFTEPVKKQLADALIALSAEAALPAQKDADARDAALIDAGRKAIISPEVNCTDCHLFRDEGGGKGPELTGWASREWTIGIIKNPAHKTYYGRRNDRMPNYGERGELTEPQIGMIADWLRAAVE